MDNAKFVRVERIDRKGDHHSLENTDYSINPVGKRKNLLCLKHGDVKRAFHHYEIECTWKGVFGEKGEYVWCPCSQLYPSAIVKYTLRLIFEKAPKREPRLFKYGEFESLEDIGKKYAENPPGGVEPIKTSVQEFSFPPVSEGDNLLCLFEM
jgi:hypothetical protein